MPRRGPERTLSAERNVARQVRMLRESEGSTYEGTAKRMTDVGCPMQGTTVYKIERSGRRITGDEIAAFAVIFGREPSRLMMPPEVVEDERLAELLQRTSVAWERAIGAVRELRAAAGEVGEHLREFEPGSDRFDAAARAVGADNLREAHASLGFPIPSSAEYAEGYSPEEHAAHDAREVWGLAT